MKKFITNYGKHAAVVAIAIVAVAVAGFIKMSHRVAQAANASGAGISIMNVTPNPATNQITVSGNAQGSLSQSGVFCPVGPNGNDLYAQGSIATPLSADGYSLDGGTGGTGTYSLTETHAGVSTNNCPALRNNVQASPYEYSFSLTDNTDIAKLSAGTHTITVCASGLSKVCDTASFSVGGTGTINVVSYATDATGATIPVPTEVQPS